MGVHKSAFGLLLSAFDSIGVHGRPASSTANGSQLGSQLEPCQRCGSTGTDLRGDPHMARNVLAGSAEWRLCVSAWTDLVVGGRA